METTTLQTFALFESIIPTVNELFLGTPLADSPLLQFVALYLLLLWSASVIWVIKDITNRTENLLLQTICIFLPLFFTPVFWIPLYILLRPRLTLFERYYEEVQSTLETQALEDSLCHICSAPIEATHVFCSQCCIPVARNCVACGRTGKFHWKYCAFCWSNPTAPDRIVPQKKKKEKKIELAAE